MADITRRTLLQGAAAGAAMLASAAAADDDPAFKIRNGRIRQSIMGWTFNPMPVDELARHCRDLGMHAMEGVDAKRYPMIRDLGLKIALTGSHGFAKGPAIRRTGSSASPRSARGSTRPWNSGRRT